MQLYWLPLITALLPLTAVHLTYLIAAQTGFVDWCVPYLDGCTSISKTGREPPASHVFKATMIPAGVLMLIYWVIAAIWLKRLGEPSRWIPYLIAGFGVIACISMIVYATVLGSTGDFYQLMRRHGIIYFFAFTAFAQLLLTSRLWKLSHRQQLSIPTAILNAKLLLMAAQIGLGLANIPIDVMDLDEWEDIVEWNFAVLMISYFLLSAIAWKTSGLVVDFRLRSCE